MKPYKIINSSGEVRWGIAGHLGGRGSKQIKRRFEKRVDADNFVLELKSRLRTLKQQAVGTKDFEETTFAQEAANWLGQRGNARFSPGHLKTASGILKELLPRFGSWKPNAFHPERMTELQNELLSSGLAPATVNRKTEVITSILNFSVRQRRIPYNPAKGFQKLEEVREEMKFWEPTETSSFLAYADRRYPSDSMHRWIYVAYLLALNTGLRAAEIWGLHPEDIVQDGRMIHVRRQFDRVKKAYRLPKGKKTRLVPCNKILLGELRLHIERRQVASGQPIFEGISEPHVNHDAFRERRFDMDVLRSGTKVIRFHDLRHTAATLMIDQGVTVPMLKDVLGHKNIATTMRYVHLLGSSLQQMSETFSIGPMPGKPRLRGLQAV